MKVILYMAISVDGFIAKSNDDTSWISKEEWNSYSQVARNAGALVVGHRTYDILTTQPEFIELKDVKIVVVSNQKDLALKAPNHFLASSPKEALRMFEGAPEVIVAGGGILNASFMSENLVDEMYVDVEPIVFGQGISLCKGGNFEKRLTLLGTKQITDNEIQLHYKVLK